MITILDSGLGNVRSILNMLDFLGIKAEITSDMVKIKKSKKLILAGVGSFDSGIKSIHERGFYNILNEKILCEKIPVLGICLGMQVMGKNSEEGSEKGFGWINAESKRFDNTQLKVPHMMWNNVMFSPQSRLLRGFPQNLKFYFAHSYHLVTNENVVSGWTEYGNKFISVIESDNISGVQFHPEKSHKFGMQLFLNFQANY